MEDHNENDKPDEIWLGNINRKRNSGDRKITRIITVRKVKKKRRKNISKSGITFNTSVKTFIIVSII